jgi:hypothetical protein
MTESQSNIEKKMTESQSNIEKKMDEIYQMLQTIMKNSSS